MEEAGWDAVLVNAVICQPKVTMDPKCYFMGSPSSFLGNKGQYPQTRSQNQGLLPPLRWFCRYVVTASSKVANTLMLKSLKWTHYITNQFAIWLDLLHTSLHLLETKLVFLTIHNLYLPIVMIYIIIRVEPEVIRVIMKLAQKLWSLFKVY